MGIMSSMHVKIHFQSGYNYLYMPMGGYNNFWLSCMHANDDHNAAIQSSWKFNGQTGFKIHTAAFANFVARYPLCPADIINCPGIHNRAIVTFFILTGIKLMGLSCQSCIPPPHYEWVLTLPLLIQNFHTTNIIMSYKIMLHMKNKIELLISIT